MKAYYIFTDETWRCPIYAVFCDGPCDHGSSLDKEALLLYSNRTHIELYSAEISIFALAKYFLNGGFHT